MKLLFSSLVFLLGTQVNAQPLIQAGGVFPNYILRPVVNAPNTQVDLWDIKDKYIILNFWGTWCTPCIPEMDSLARLQQIYGSRVQIIGVSDDSRGKLIAYLKKRPTPIWLASDTSSNLYRQAAFRYVGQSILLNPDKDIVALVKTDSINARLIEQFISGKPLHSNAETEWVGARQSETDPFGIDSSGGVSVALRSFMPGKSSMSKTYLNTPLEGRRLTYYNVCPTNLYTDAYGIESPAQLIYEVDKNKVCNYNDKTTLICFDLLVGPFQKDSLKIIMQQKLNVLLPYKARIEKQKIAVYVLTGDSMGVQPAKTSKSKTANSFSGKGFSGTAIPMSTFAQYLSNEVGRPVVDETGLVDRYDIETKLTLRTKDEVLDSVKGLGLRMQKAEREMPVLVLYE